MATSLGEAEQMMIAAERNKVKLAIGTSGASCRAGRGEAAARRRGHRQAGPPLVDGRRRPAQLGHPHDRHDAFIMGDPAATAVVGAVQRTDRLRAWIASEIS